ncbi:MAG: IS66 family insertion sequence element accessory protein TnpB [Bacteroidota bacterium]
MRKSFDALCLVVEMGMERNPLSGEVFIFINRPRNRMKLLRWDYGGFVLYYKRLESGTFELPKDVLNGSSVVNNWSQLVMMVQGISLQHIRTRKRFAETKMLIKKV